MRRITVGDVEAQISRMTELTRDILVAVADGTDMYGRTVAQAVEAPYPQVYYTLSTLKARGFLHCAYGEGEHANHKVYTLTGAGLVLTDRVRDQEFPEVRGSQRVPVDPETYARRMKMSGVLKWLKAQGVLDSHEELTHVMGCELCSGYMRQYGMTSDVRCQTYADIRNAQANGRETI